MFIFLPLRLLKPLVSCEIHFSPSPPISGPGLVKTHGGHSFRPRVRYSSPPPTGGSNPNPDLAPAATAAAPPALLPSPLLARVLLPCLLLLQQQLLLQFLLLLLLPHTDMLSELAPLPHLLHIQGQPGGPHLPKGPRPLAQGSLPVLGPKSPIHDLIRALLEIPFWIYPRL